jgi:glycosyltransferase involved in cell wall biosynthesis
MSSPLVSICVPTLNCRRFLEERMDTILAQTLPDWEMIVCDSHSADGTWEFFQKFAKDSRVRLFQVPRAGMLAGFNECFRRVRGEFVYVATADDTADPLLLETMVSLSHRFPDVKMFSCNYTMIDEQGKPIDPTAAPYQAAGVGINGEEIYGDWLRRDHRRHGPSEFVATCVGSHVWTTFTSIVFRASLLQDTGLMSENKTSMADIEWALRVCLFTDTVHIARPLATFRIYPSQSTQRLDFARIAHLQAQMIQDTLQEFARVVPPQFTTPKGRAKLLLAKRILAFNALELYWQRALQHPGTFFSRFAKSLGSYPDLAVRLMLHGFVWRLRPNLDRRQYVEDLLKEFKLPPLCTAVDLGHL